MSILARGAQAAVAEVGHVATENQPKWSRKPLRYDDRREEALLGRLPGDTKAAKVLGIEGVDCQVSLGCLSCE